MQHLRHSCNFRLLVNSFAHHTAGQIRLVRQQEFAACNFSLPASCTAAPEQPVAYHSCTSCTEHASVQVKLVSGNQCSTATLLPTARIKPGVQQHVSASSLTSTRLHMAVCHLGLAASSQLHTSVSRKKPSSLDCHQSESVPQPESAARQKQWGPDISLLNATQQSQWDHARNANLGNILIKPRSSRKAHWTCTKCPVGLPHHWTAAVSDILRSSRKNRSGCPYCSGRDVCPHNSLAQQAPLVAAEWDTTRNLDKPQDWTLMSKHRAHWVCKEGHQWQAKIQDRTHRNRGCPDCADARRGQRAPSLTASSGHIMQIWDDAENAKAGLDPHKLTCGSQVKAHFKCSQKHQWTARIVDIARNTSTTGCSACHRQSTRKHLD